MQNALFTPSFSPSRNEPCFCGTGKKFKSCCGKNAPSRKPPHGIYLQKKAITLEANNRLLVTAEQAEKTWLTTGSVDPKSGEVSYQRDSTRVTEFAQLDDQQRYLDDLIQCIWLETVQRKFKVDIAWFEQPHVLCYQADGFYGAHSDSEHFHPQSQQWERKVDRDLSLLLYLNADFEGGKLHFVNFDYRYTPRAADLVVFPSDQRYRHQAEKVTSGQRYCVVSWASVKGGLRANPEPPANAIPI